MSWAVEYTAHCIFHISYFIFHISYFIFHISYFIFHISYLISHISYFIFYISYFIFHISLGTHLIADDRPTTMSICMDFNFYILFFEVYLFVFSFFILDLFLFISVVIISIKCRFLCKTWWSRRRPGIPGTTTFPPLISSFSKNKDLWRDRHVLHKNLHLMLIITTEMKRNKSRIKNENTKR